MEVDVNVTLSNQSGSVEANAVTTFSAGIIEAPRISQNAAVLTKEYGVNNSFVISKNRNIHPALIIRISHSSALVGFSICSVSR